MDTDRQLLEELEPALREWGDGYACAMLALIARDGVPIPAEELRAALRRALLIIAAEGDPRRDLDAEGPGVASFALDLDAPERRAALAASLGSLRDAADGLPRAAFLLETLLGDHDFAWRSLAVALLAEELGEDA
jgi:hypothetical protein